nr:hypothetical protein [Tanacetum cinerariifolium]
MKSVSRTVTVCETKKIIPSVPSEVKDTKQESKLNELTKLVQMLIDEKVNSNQEIQESTSKIQKTKSSKSVDSSRMSQESKPKVQNTGSSKLLKPKPIQKPQLKCKLCHYTNHSTDTLELMLFKTSRKHAKGLLLLVEDLMLLVQVKLLDENVAAAEKIKKLLYVISAVRVILKTVSYIYYCQYKVVSVVQLFSAASIVVNTVSSKLVLLVSVALLRCMQIVRNRYALSLNTFCKPIRVIIGL